jgi:hypothetical protein
MSLCRRLLHRTVIPICVAGPFSTSRSFVTSQKSSNFIDGCNTPLGSSTVSNTPNESNAIPFLHLPVERLVEALANFRIPRTLGVNRGNSTDKTIGKGVEGVQESNEKVEVMEPLEIYSALRSRDKSVLATLPVDVFFDLAKRAVNMKSRNVTENLAEDALETLAGRATDQRELAKKLIKHSVALSMKPDTLLALFRFLEPGGAHPCLNTKSFEHLARTLLEPQVVSMEVVKLLTPGFIARLPRHNVPLGSQAMKHTPPSFVELSFRLVQKLAAFGLYQTALDVFTALFTTRNIPAEAFHGMHNTTADFESSILTMLVRSALHWRWRRLAVNLLRDLLERPESEATTRLIHSLVEEVIVALLSTPSLLDLADCCWLLLELDRRADDPLPKSLIALFYDAAAKLDLGSQAEAFYAYTQSPSVQTKRCYPSPEGQALTWLMDHLTGKSRNMHLGRQLAKQVVSLETPIPYQDRGRFIAITATYGYGTEARALWERYSVGRDREVVVGNAATMIRMTSLFVKIQEQVHSKFKKLEAIDGLRRASAHSGKVESSYEGSRDDLHQRAGYLGLPRTLSREQYQERLTDLATFVERIVGEFRRVKEPLSNAHHYDLSSLARAYFILGNVSAGFEAFRFLLSRREIPELHDINIALGMMATYDPKSSARLVERLVKKGLKPDAITYGTILHHATLHGEMRLVEKLVRESKSLVEGHLTFQSISSLIRASLNPKGSIITLRNNLRRVLNVIQLLEDSRFVCSPNTGKYCISASLRVGDPLMAFRFWKMLVKGKTQWEDWEQVFQRRLIVSMTRKHMACGWLQQDQGKMMLSLLAAGEVDNRTVNEDNLM